LRTIAIVQHDALGPPALIGEYLRDARFGLDIRRLDWDDPLPDAAELDGLAALVTIGEPASADEEGRAVLAAERTLLAAALAREVPVLAVGLGARQLCLAGGGDVYARAGLTLGWEPLEFAARDGFVWDVHPRPLVFSWRAFVCRLPDDALLLADTAAEPQIFRLGEVAWGVAFHPEVDKDLLRLWFETDPALIEATYPGGLKKLGKMSRREMLRSAMLCGQLMANFLTAGRVRER
jgi:GMP synthase-like glutamine amidotransferase